MPVRSHSERQAHPEPGSAPGPASLSRVVVEVGYLDVGEGDEILAPDTEFVDAVLLLHRGEQLRDLRVRPTGLVDDVGLSHPTAVAFEESLDPFLVAEEVLVDPTGGGVSLGGRDGGGRRSHFGRWLRVDTVSGDRIGGRRRVAAVGCRVTRFGRFGVAVEQVAESVAVATHGGDDGGENGDDHAHQHESRRVEPPVVGAVVGWRVVGRCVVACLVAKQRHGECLTVEVGWPLPDEFTVSGGDSGVEVRRTPRAGRRPGAGRR